MSTFDLSASIARAELRLGRATRRRRADAGRSRLPAALDRRLHHLLAGVERPVVREIVAELRALATELGVRAPSRATIYNAIDRAPVPRYRCRDLPDHVQRALYNLDLDGAQLAFYAFNYGDLAAASFAAGLPWLALHQAARRRGWRPQSRGLLMAAARWRRIA